MVGSGLLYARDLIVSLDYGQFYLYPYLDPDADLEDDFPDMDEIVQLAIGAGGIAQNPEALVVLSPHQMNFKMPLRVEVWDGPPPGDPAEWPEAFEAHLDVGNRGLAYDSPVEHFAELGVPPGAYHALITGRGFVAHGSTGSMTPGDSWWIQLWPSAGPQGPGACAPGALRATDPKLARPRREDPAEAPAGCRNSPNYQLRARISRRCAWRACAASYLFRGRKLPRS